MGIKVIKAGLQTTIQDLGRSGFRQYGIASNGALDEYNHRLANWLVGKAANQATIEITQIGPTLEFLESMMIGIAGAEFELFINDSPCSANRTLNINKGDILRFGRLKSGVRAYLAFSGELDIEPVMNSQSTSLLASFGGYKGRALQNNDTLSLKSLPFEKDSFKKLKKIPAELQLEHHHNLQQNHMTVRITKGREFERLNPDAQKRFLQSNFEVNSYSNRMAIKLDGEALKTTNDVSIITSPITAGTIQLPPSGQPLITLADGQTTGGYPRIGQVTTADLSLLAQLKAGDTLSFYPVSIEQALNTLLKKNEYIDSFLNQT